MEVSEHFIGHYRERYRRALYVSSDNMPLLLGYWFILVGAVYTTPRGVFFSLEETKGGIFSY